jgi:hypothetical protein
VVEEGQGVVSEESDNEVVVQPQQVERVREEKRDPAICQCVFSQRLSAILPVISSDQGHAEELHDIEEHPDWYEGANRNVPAVAKLQLFLSAFLSKVVQSSPASG